LNAPASRDDFHNNSWKTRLSLALHFGTFVAQSLAFSSAETAAHHAADKKPALASAMRAPPKAGQE
jgi:hypothetical protein